MSKHTPEPWAVGVGVDGKWGRHHASVRTDNIPFPIASTMFFGITPQEECEANAARVVACVNALAGIPDPAAEMARLRAVEAALTRIASMPTDRFSPEVTASFLHEAISLARAAKVGGGA